jgi:hypothetical protein
LLAAYLPGLPAFLTALGRISKAFLVEELLLTTRPSEFLLTVNAGACLVFKLTHFLLPFFLPTELSVFGFGPGFIGSTPFKSPFGMYQITPRGVSSE